MTERLVILLGVVLGAVGVWLLLPRGRVRGRLAGAAATAASLGLLASQLPPVGDWAAQSIFALLAAVTVGSAVATITLRNPVYCAIWFGMSLMGTAGLFLLQGAQFLAVATIIVYAGAILVTFLFVLMLAEPKGRALYDRVSWESLISALSGAFLVGILSLTVASVLTRADVAPPVAVTDDARQQGILSAQHVVQIGHVLFDHYLIAVEAVGVLLLAALVGAAVIVGRAKGPLAEAPVSPKHGGPRRG
jgi:NADH-quinone oxidoreductase subunit J